MTKQLGMGVLCGAILAISTWTDAATQETRQAEYFYDSSLHATGRGMAYWYHESNGGFETITGVPYQEAGCSRCHVSSCDACHKTERNGKPVYATANARNQEMCLSCHGREAHMIMKIDKEAHTPDVHVAQGMVCMDCHTAREVHGDGVAYTSMKEPEAMDVKCKQCHESPQPSISHTVHGNKLSCQACHVRHVVSCNSCHFETMMKEKKRVSLPVTGWKFLMNYDGKVTSANMQSFVAPENKTFLIFAPQFSHSVMKEGSRCEECHGTETVKQILKGKIPLTWLKEGKEKNLKGVIPVASGVTYQCLYHNYENGTWTPISNPSAPKVQYVGYGSPLTEAQLRRMMQKQNSTH